MPAIRELGSRKARARADAHQAAKIANMGCAARDHDLGDDLYPRLRRVAPSSSNKRPPTGEDLPFRMRDVSVSVMEVRDIGIIAYT